MSKQIDERVVSMQFDNKNFEKNASTTMSTLEKLKQSLNFSGAAKGFEDINASVKKVDMGILANGVDTVGLRFNALYTIADQTLRNITNKVEQTAMRTAKMFTIEPVSTGFNEYELKMDSIQTIMASTGESLDTVNRYLEELNKYSDETIYSFSDMTQNIGKFTNAGVKLEDAVKAIKGISNEAAVSGANANEASRAMYNFSQALSAGYVKLIDWKSIENANMATVEFKNQLITTALELGTVTKASDGMYKTLSGKTFNATRNFNDVLQEQWMTSDVLVTTLGKYADTTTEIGKKASEAATQVKTFSKMMDTLKETVQSGWAQTWELIVGDYAESKELFTSISNVVGGWIDAMSKNRNTLVYNVLESQWKKLTDKINEAGIKIEDFEEAIRNSEKAQKQLIKKNKNWEELIDTYGSLGKVFESGALSADILAEAFDSVKTGATELELTIDRLLNKGTKGNDVKQMQKVLKQLGYELGNFGENKDGIDGVFGSVTQAAVRAFQEANGLTVDGIVGPETLKALEAATSELNKTADAAEGLNGTIEDLISNITELGGRDKIIKAFSTLWEKISKIGSAVKETWKEVFKEFPSAEEILMKAIDAFSNFVDNLDDSDEKIKQITTTVEGLLRVIELCAIFSGGVFGIVVKILKTVADELDVDFFNVTETIAEMIIVFRNWLIVDNKLYDALIWLGEGIIGFVKSTSSAIKAWYNNFVNLENVQAIFTRLSEAFDNFRNNGWDWLKGFGTIFRDFASALSSLDEISLEDVQKALSKMWDDLVSHFGKLGDLIEPIKNAFGDLGGAVIDSLSKFGIIGDVIQWFKDAKKAYDDWVAGVEGSEDLPKRVAESIANGLDVVVKIVVGVLQGVWNQIVGFFSGLSGELTIEMTDGAEKAAVGFITGLVKALWNGLKFVGQVMVELGKIAVNKLNETLVSHGFDEIPTDMFAGFVNGIQNGASSVWAAIVEFGKTILAKIKEVLGIHSPSTEMYEIGGYAAEGFVNGFEDFLPVLWDIIKDFGKKLLDFVMDIDLGQILAMAVTAGTMKTISTLAKAITSFSNMMDGITDITKGINNVLNSVAGVIGGLKDVEKSISGYINAKKMTLWADAIKSLAIAIAILAAAVITLTFVDPKKLWMSVGVIAALAAIIGALSFAISKIGDGADGAVKVGKFALVVLSFGVVLYAMSKIVKQLGKLTSGELTQGCVALGVLTAFVIALTAATRLIAKTPKGNTDAAIFKVGTMLMQIAAAMLIMAVAIKMIGSITPEKFDQAVRGLIALGAFIAAMMAATRLIAKTEKGNTATAVYKSGVMLLGMASAIMILVVAAKIIAGMEEDELKQAGLGLVALGVFLTGLILATKLIARTSSGNAASEVYKIGTMLMGMATAILILTIAAKVIAGMEEDEMKKAGVGLLALVGLIALLTKITNVASEKDILKAGVMLLLMSAAIGILAVVSTLLGMLSIEHIAKGVIAVGLLGLVMAAMIAATKGAQDCSKNIMMMTVAIGVMSVAVVALSLIPIEKLAAATGALSALILVFTILVSAADNAKGSIGTLIVLAGVITLLGGILFLLAQYSDTSKCLEAAISLSALMVAMSLVLKILEPIGKNAKTALYGVAALTAMAVPLIAFVGVLAVMQNIKNATDNALILVGLASAMTMLLIPLTVIGSFGKSGAPYLGALALLAMAVPLIAFVGVLAVMQNIQNAIVNANVLVTLATAMTLLLIPLTVIGAFGMTGAPYLGALALLTMAVPLIAFVGVLAAMEGIPNADANANALIKMAISFTAVCAALTVIGTFALGALAGIGVMTTLIVSMGVLIAAIGKLAETNPKLEEFLNIGIPILEKIGFALGSFFGNIVGGFAKGVTDGLPGIGANLSAFMINAQPFINGAKMIDEATMTGVKTLADAIITLTKADIIEGLTSWFTGGSSLADFGLEIAEFGVHLKAFADNVAGIDSASVTGAAQAAKTLAEMASIVPNEGGMAAWFAGENSLASFGTNIVSFGSNLKAFAENVSGINTESISTAAEAGKALAEMANTVPNSGGLVAWFSGENSFATFSSNLPTLGTNIAAFVSNLGTFTDDQVATVGCVASALKELANATNTIPNEGGIVTWFAGDNSLAAFSGILPGLGTNMASFVSNLGTFTEDQVSTVACVASAIKELVNASNTIPNEGGLAAIFAGDNSLAAFSGSLPTLGTNLASFVSNLGTFSSEQVSTVDSAIRAIKAFAQLADSDLSGLKSDLSGFGNKLADFGSDLADFCDEISGETDVDLAVSNMKKIVDAAKGITDGSVTALKNLGTTLKNFAKDGVKGFVNAFTSVETTNNIKDAAAKLAEKVMDGIKSKKEAIKTAAQTLASAGASAIKTEDMKSKYYSAGSYLVTGFKNGVTENAFKAEAAATAMAQAALEAAKEVFDENSPSKEFYKIGKFVAEGLANGITDSARLATDSSGQMATDTIDGAKSIISKASEYLVNGIDAQPTIRPVLDLSDITANASKITSLFDMSPSVGVLANVGAISNGMNSGQNGKTNEDVINAINGLKDNLPKKPGDTYTIGNITYDDGSEVSNAIKTLVRAARVERRT